MTFAKKLQQWRGDLTQSEAAKILHVGLDSYRNWEQGRTTPSGLARVTLNIRMDNYDRKQLTK
jgi:DNA-binding transcriptional regulator YiaG